MSFRGPAVHTHTSLQPAMPCYQANDTSYHQGDRNCVNPPPIKIRGLEFIAAEHSSNNHSGKDNHASRTKAPIAACLTGNGRGRLPIVMAPTEPSNAPAPPIKAIGQPAKSST